jgi:hypothetical protein
MAVIQVMQHTNRAGRQLTAPCGGCCASDRCGSCLADTDGLATPSQPSSPHASTDVFVQFSQHTFQSHLDDLHAGLLPGRNAVGKGGVLCRAVSRSTSGGDSSSLLSMSLVSGRQLWLWTVMPLLL